MDDDDPVSTTTQQGARQALWLVAGSYLIDCALLLGYVALELASPSLLAFYGGWGLAHAVMLEGLWRARVWQRCGLATPTFWQTLPTIAMLLVLLSRAPGAAPLFVSVLFVVVAFSAVALHTRHILVMIATVSIGLPIALSAVPPNAPGVGATLDERLLAALVLSIGLARCLSLGLWAQSMRARLARQNVELADSLRKLDELAAIDPLTGTLNRRRVLETVGLTGRRPVEPDAAVCVAMLDLDHFKIVNDRFGHLIGDQVLRRFAQVVASQLRASDTIGRYGGEEFLIVLRTASVANAAHALERIRQAVARFDWSSIAEGLQVTVSIGATRCRGEESPDVLLARADVALYRAKREGRDRVQLDTV